MHMCTHTRLKITPYTFHLPHQFFPINKNANREDDEAFWDFYSVSNLVQPAQSANSGSPAAAIVIVWAVKNLLHTELFQGVSFNCIGRLYATYNAESPAASTLIERKGKWQRKQKSALFLKPDMKKEAKESSSALHLIHHPWTLFLMQ